MANERRHKPFREFALSQPCCCQPCVSSVVLHHHTAGETEPHSKSLGGRRGKGQRASDEQGMPLCFRHHKDLHELRGFFADFDKAKLRKWQDDQVERLQRLYAMAWPEPRTASAEKPKRPRIGKGWTLGGVLDLLRKEARHRTGEVSAAFSEVADLIERDTY